MTDRPKRQGKPVDPETDAILRDASKIARIYESHGSLRAAGEHLDVDPMTVRNWLIRHGIPRNRRGSVRLGSYAEERLGSRLWVYRAYVRDGRTCVDIASELHCSVQTVANALERHGIEARPTGNPVMGRAAQLLADAAWLHAQVHTERRTYRDIATELGVSTRTIENYLDAHEIPRSTSRDAVADATVTADEQAA